MLNKPVLVIGAGGHAAVLVEILRQLDCQILGLVASAPPSTKPIFSGLNCYTSDDDVLKFNAEDILLVNAVGALPGKNLRVQLHEKFKRYGYHFMTVVSPNAIVSDYALLAEGVQLLPGSIVNANAVIGVASIINSGAIVEHDCSIGRFNHIAPGSVLSGDVVTEDFVHIGTGANVIQGIHIGEHTVVGAGATVTKNLASNKTLYVAKPFLR